MSVGPDGYHGLPGMILGVEKDGNMLILASKVDLSVQEKISNPNDGQKIKRDAFDKTVIQKIEEWEKGPKKISSRRG